MPDSCPIYHKSNAYTMSRVFDRDMLEADWQRQHHDMARAMIASYLQGQAAALR
ncbi:hypothetical protein RA280_21245 [Cupriavidus sp. CV2]|uniref:hypothetical protein n=1 Tax=Cupriavidus ulmosensis TaxID=3065913 RepID=UPI00296B0DC8|nr:hypothetical protein [Cupriavidus sp. CV2]MDW3684232.1 hypothetical protein [Cupriavidus sp. CV2]